jgi:alcohol dehydrogenase
MGPMDLLVRVHATSVNPLDAKTRDGKLKTLLKYRFPLVLGSDF